MENYIKTIKDAKLFSDMTENEIFSALNCISIKTKKYKKDEYIFKIGDLIYSLPLVVCGSIHIEKEDFLGNKTILSKVCVNDIFGASYYYDNTPLPNNIISIENTIVMYIDIKKALNSNCPCCKLNTKITDNFIKIILLKNKVITKKIEHISQRTIRNKLVSYLSDESIKNNSNSFFIPFNRQQLADYLCVDRSAISNELSKMRNENLINFNKNFFELNESFKDIN